MKKSVHKNCTCVLCEFAELHNEHFTVSYDPFPVGVGHVKMIPRRHAASMFDLTAEEKTAFFDVLERTKRYLDTSLGKHRPDGYTIGVNIGKAAGQTVEHLHIHLIPRYAGDVDDPRGGVRNIKEPLVGW